MDEMDEDASLIGAADDDIELDGAREDEEGAAHGGGEALAPGREQHEHESWLAVGAPGSRTDDGDGDDDAGGMMMVEHGDDGGELQVYGEDEEEEEMLEEISSDVDDDGGSASASERALDEDGDQARDGSSGPASMSASDGNGNQAGGDGADVEIVDLDGEDAEEQEDGDEDVGLDSGSARLDSEDEDEAQEALDTGDEDNELGDELSRSQESPGSNSLDLEKSDKDATAAGNNMGVDESKDPAQDTIRDAASGPIESAPLVNKVADGERESQPVAPAKGEAQSDRQGVKDSTEPAAAAARSEPADTKHLLEQENTADAQDAVASSAGQAAVGDESETKAQVACTPEQLPAQAKPDDGKGNATLSEPATSSQAPASESAAPAPLFGTKSAFSASGLSAPASFGAAYSFSTNSAASFGSTAFGAATFGAVPFGASTAGSAPTQAWNSSSLSSSPFVFGSGSNTAPLFSFSTSKAVSFSTPVVATDRFAPVSNVAAPATPGSALAFFASPSAATAGPTEAASVAAPTQTAPLAASAGAVESTVASGTHDQPVHALPTSSKDTDTGSGGKDVAMADSGDNGSVGAPEIAQAEESMEKRDPAVEASPFVFAPAVAAGGVDFSFAGASGTNAGDSQNQGEGDNDDDSDMSTDEDAPNTSAAPPAPVFVFGSQSVVPGAQAFGGVPLQVAPEWGGTSENDKVKHKNGSLEHKTETDIAAKEDVKASGTGAHKYQESALPVTGGSHVVMMYRARLVDNVGSTTTPREDCGWLEFQLLQSGENADTREIHFVNEETRDTVKQVPITSLMQVRKLKLKSVVVDPLGPDQAGFVMQLLSVEDADTVLAKFQHCIGRAPASAPASGPALQASSPKVQVAPLEASTATQDVRASGSAGGQLAKGSSSSLSKEAQAQKLKARLLKLKQKKVSGSDTREAKSAEHQEKNVDENLQTLPAATSLLPKEAAVPSVSAGEAETRADAGPSDVPGFTSDISAAPAEKPSEVLIDTALALSKEGDHDQGSTVVFESQEDQATEPAAASAMDTESVTVHPGSPIDLNIVQDVDRETPGPESQANAKVIDPSDHGPPVDMAPDTAPRQFSALYDGMEVEKSEEGAGAEATVEAVAVTKPTLDHGKGNDEKCESDQGAHFLEPSLPPVVTTSDPDRDVRVETGAMRPSDSIARDVECRASSPPCANEQNEPSAQWTAEQLELDAEMTDLRESLNRSKGELAAAGSDLQSALEAVRSLTKTLRGFHQNALESEDLLASVPLEKKCRPWERADFMRRLHSFKPSWWACKSPAIDAVECARRGWYNSGYNRLKSEDGAEIVFRAERVHDMSPGAEEETARVLELICGAGHAVLSGWIGNLCPAAFGSLPYESESEYAATLTSRIRLVEDMAMNVVVAERAIDALGNMFERCKAQSQSAGAPSMLSLVVAICGWVPVSASSLINCSDLEWNRTERRGGTTMPHFGARAQTSAHARFAHGVVLECEFCRQQLDLETLEKEQAFDVLLEHRPYCCFVRADAWKAAGRILLKALEQRDQSDSGDGDPDSERKRVVEPDQSTISGKRLRVE
ncbi:hypothetical protein FVE85_7789 [Porphyridium purpureum]|uniref:C3HC-type domain-containing protein n=1 Tax=Porphyridium purpureum TaxID=35688 RepID=A0A5J4YJF7_PORPP|nr:hypothetical protein FVE85_7789 [Porphyridium purpureum]|eukprot:POR4615..scf210_14